MQRFKKIVLLMLVCQGVFAGAMGLDLPCTANQITIPCPAKSWDVSGYALYFQPTINDTGLPGYITTLDTTTFNYTDFNPEWAWGFKLEGIYHFSTGNDLHLNWYHVHQDSTHDFSRVTDPVGGISTGAVTLHPKWDMVNLEWGQHANIIDLKSIRFHGGISYSRIEQEMAQSVISRTTVASVSLAPYQRNSQQTYNGFGPRGGMDLVYGWSNGLGFYINAAGGLLIGTTTSNTVTSAQGATSLYTNASSTALVPELDARLGATYDYMFSKNRISFDLGWMWINYFDALVYRTILSSSLAQNARTNFGEQGVYFGLKWSS